MSNAVQALKKRGLITEVTSSDVFTRLSPPAAVYAGFDPSSDSLQAGNLVAIMILRRLQDYGHKVVALVGGATGLVGDPSGKASERNLLAEEQVRKNSVSIRKSLSKFIDTESRKAPGKIVNNADWLASFPFVEFLRDVGKHFRMGTMLGKESVRARLAAENGMSFAEFSYQLLQAYDFLHLYDTEECVLQAGGSDQWGNITAGIDLVRKLRSVEVFGATAPLVCDSSGRKLGKSEQGTVYLDSRKTPVYDFYQYFIRTEDADVIRYLRIFTTLPDSEIDDLRQETESSPEKRLAQRKLAEEITRLVHGKEGLESAHRASSLIFGEAMDGLHADELLAVFSDAPSVAIDSAEVDSMPIVDLSVRCGLCESRSEARRLIKSGGLYMNNNRVTSAEEKVSYGRIIDGRLLVLRSGKKNYRLVKVQN
ncbi:MAG: tyrosine--tRNA ligase [Kiritimatiellia bacterium]